MKKILITGGAGCVGANYIDRLNETGFDGQILVIDNFATSARAALPANSSDFEVIEGSIEDCDLVESLFARFKPTHVLHSAASYKDPDDYAQDGMTNVAGTMFVVEAAKKHCVKRIVNLQTALCYGRPDTTPIPVESPVRPFTSYGVSKTAGEQIIAKSGLNYISMRLANVTGPRLSIGPIPTFYTRLKAGKNCFCSDTLRDFLDMSDFLNMLELAMDETSPQGIFNVSTGEGKSIKQVYDVVADYLGISGTAPPIVPPEPDDVPVVVLDSSKTKEVFGWEAKVSFEDSLRNMLKWYDDNGVKAVYAHLKAPKDVQE